MSVRQTIRNILIEEGNSSTGRQEQINKIIQYYKSGQLPILGPSGNTQKGLCHARTGVEISKRNNSTDFVVLVGAHNKSIYHSYLVDKDGKSLIDGNPNIAIGTKSVTLSVNGNQMMNYPYVEFIKVSDLLAGSYQWN